MNSVRENIEASITDFIKIDGQLLIDDVNEQTLTHRLASIIQAYFEDWNVDCEYNRDQGTTKSLNYALYPNGEVNERNVVPDIIVHKSRTAKNLVVIEVKKTTNNEGDDRDIEKLNAFKEQLGYTEALFIRFIAGEKEPGIKRMEWM